MTLPQRFLGAFAKHRWAQKHIQELSNTLTSFHEGGYWRPEQAPDVPEGMVRIRLLHSPPEEIGLLLGDAVHNMRSALDYATCALVENHNPAADLRFVQFPFGTPGQLLSTKQRSKLGDIGSFELNMIEEARRCGGEALRLLKLLSNQDKHRLLLATVARQFPMKLHFDIESQTADFVTDDSAEDVWFRPLSDNIIIPMPQILNLRLGIEIEGYEAPFVINTINQVNHAVGIALRLMANSIDPIIA